MRAMVILAAIGLGALASAEACGQYSERVVVATSSSPAGPGSGRALSRERVERMAEAVGMDDLQLEIAQEMLKEVMDKRQSLADTLRQQVEDAREFAESGEIEKMMSAMKEANGAYQDAVESLETTYLEDMRALLLPEQEEAWPKAERIYRRGKMLGSLMRSQARVDVEELVRSEFAEAYERPDVGEVLDGWAVQVDGLLVERARKSEDLSGGSDFRGGVFILDGEDTFKPLREIDARIVSAGERAMRTLSAVLEDDGVEDAWIRQAFARVYRQTDGERRLEAALALESLTEDQRGQLDAAASQHERDASAARDRWVQAEKEREADSTLPPGVTVTISGGEPSPSDLARDAVKELDDRLQAKLDAILTPEQLAALPESSPERPEAPVPVAPGSRSIRIGG